MRYYAHYGHKDFILCLGYRGDTIKNYFRNYDECVSNDFVISGGGRNVEMITKDIDDWTITCIDTGLNSNIGQRLAKVRKYVEGDAEFMANYADGLTDLSLDTLYDSFRKSGKAASFLGVKPMASYHVISSNPDGTVTDVKSTALSPARINGGFFIFKNSIFDYMRDGEELVEQPFRRLIEARQLHTYSYDGFWACMDTFKERTYLDQVFSMGTAPWEVWRQR
jgi:glucose-1-phosphate cytidylyltransferase